MTGTVPRTSPTASPEPSRFPELNSPAPLTGAVRPCPADSVRLLRNGGFGRLCCTICRSYLRRGYDAPGQNFWSYFSSAGGKQQGTAACLVGDSGARGGGAGWLRERVGSAADCCGGDISGGARRGSPAVGPGSPSAGQGSPADQGPSAPDTPTARASAPSAGATLATVQDIGATREISNPQGDGFTAIHDVLGQNYAEASTLDTYDVAATSLRPCRLAVVSLAVGQRVLGLLATHRSGGAGSPCPSLSDDFGSA